MKLHLPKSLLCAVLTVCISPTIQAGSWTTNDCYTFDGKNDVNTLNASEGNHVNGSNATWIRAGANELTPTLSEILQVDGTTLNISGTWSKGATTEAFKLLTIEKLKVGTEGQGSGSLVIASNVNGGNMPLQTIQLNDIDGTLSSIQVLDKGKLILKENALSDVNNVKTYTQTIQVNKGGTICVGDANTTEIKLNQLSGNGTLEVTMATMQGDKKAWDNTLALKEFSGETYLKSGHFDIYKSTEASLSEATGEGANIAQVGGTLHMGPEAHLQITGDKTVVLNANLVLDKSTGGGTDDKVDGTEFHQNGSATLTINGTVTGDGIYNRRGGGTLTFNNSVDLGGFYNCTNATSNFNADVSVDEMRVTEGTVNIGNENGKDIIATVGRFEMGDTEGTNASIINIASGSTLKVTGNKNSEKYSNSLLIGEWNSPSTANINGQFLSKDAVAHVGDTSMSFVIGESGTMAVAGIAIATEKSNTTQATSLVLSDGGKLLLGSAGIASNLKSPDISLGAGTVGTYAEAASLGTGMKLTSEKGTIFDTTRYEFSSDGNSIQQVADGAGANITVNGTLSGAGSLVKNGKGNLILTVANSYEGTTTINNGTIKLQGNGSLGRGTVTIAREGSLSIEDANGNAWAGITSNGGSGNIVKGASITKDNSNKTISINGNGSASVNGALISLMEGASLKLENVTLGAGTKISGAEIATVDADGSVSSTGNALTLADTTIQIATSSTSIEVLSDPLSSDMALALDLSTDVKGIAVTASTFANVSLTGEMELNITGDLISKLIQDDCKYVAITFAPSVTWSTDTVTITGASFGNGQPAGGVVIDNGTIYVSVPEPTTATLSLLALAALAARRRRK